MIIGIEPIKKGSFWDRKAFEKNMAWALNRGIALCHGDFQKTISTFNHPRPKFVKKGAHRDLSRLSALVYTLDERYYYLTEGTKKHWVAPRNKPRMAWTEGYSMKTSPRVIGASAGGKTGGPWRYSMGHYISGIEAREFEIEIAKRKERPFKNFVDIGIMQATGG